MERRSDSVPSSSRSSPRATQLRLASDQLASILESLELESETELAEEVVDAIIAIEQAYEIETEDRSVSENSDRSSSSPLSSNPSQFGETFIN